MGIIIRPIQDGDNLKWLGLGHTDYAPLKAFLRKTAWNFHNQELAKTYVVVDEELPGIVGAYLTLVCSEIQNTFDAEVDFAGAQKYTHLPAVKLARMAVDERWRQSPEQRIGTSMMDWCIAHVLRSVMPHVGCRFMVVDAKAGAVGFYQKVGFTMLNTEENKQKQSPIMFIDLAKVQQRLDREDPPAHDQPHLPLG